PLPLRSLDLRQFRQPLLPVPPDQLFLTEAQPHRGGVPGRQARQLDLHADELGALGSAVLLQPVGVDEARDVVIDVGDYAREAASLQRAAHGTPSRTGASRPATKATTAARSLGTSHRRDALTKSSQRADDRFMAHHEAGPNTARASAPVRPRAANDSATASRASPASIGMRASNRRRPSRSLGRQ